MTVIKEPGFTEEINDVGSAQTGRRIDVATVERSDHRAEFKNLQAEQMGG